MIVKHRAHSQFSICVLTLKVLGFSCQKYNLSIAPEKLALNTGVGGTTNRDCFLVYLHLKGEKDNLTLTDGFSQLSPDMAMLLFIILQVKPPPVPTLLLKQNLLPNQTSMKLKVS